VKGRPVAPLRVGLVAETIDRPGGMGRYARELAAALARRPDVELVVAAPASARDRLAELPAARAVRVVPLPSRGQVADGVWEHLRLGGVLEAAGAQVVHGTKHIVPRTRRPTVLTVHDLTALSWPGQAGWAKRLLLPPAYRASMRRATALLAVSGATRDRLADFDPSWRSKAVAVPNGTSADLRLLDPRPVPELDGRPFALVVGDLSPRKNVAVLVDIWEDVFRETGAVLALAGDGGLRSRDLGRSLRGLEARGLVLRLGSVPGPELRWCYERCRVVLYPSVEEGFGFPVVEARLFGAPVVASTDPAVVEAASGRAVHVEASDRPGWRDAVVRALRRDGEPAGGAGVADHGPMPTWDDHAAGAVRIYRRVLGADPRPVATEAVPRR